MTLVFNASPLIVLAKAGLIDTVLTFADRVLVPRPVALEIAQFNQRARQYLPQWSDSLA
jgi:predicted nucleic acid-binding protein